MWKEDSSCLFSIIMLHERVSLKKKRGSFLTVKLSNNVHDVPQVDLLMEAGDMNSTLDQRKMFLRI